MVSGYCSQNFNETVNVYGSDPKIVKVGHYVFGSMSGWKISELLKHPTIQLKASDDKQAFSQMNIRCPKQYCCKINVVRDTGGQSCLGTSIVT